MLELTTDVKYVKGVGPRNAAILETKGIHTVEDLLYYLPFRYEDRLNPRGIAELKPGEMATVIAEVRSSGLFRTRKMPIFQMTAGQGRTSLKCLWFNATYLRDRFKPGEMVALYGRVDKDKRGALQIVQPQFEILGMPDEAGEEGALPQTLEVGRIVPIYETAGNLALTSRWFRRVIYRLLESIPEDLPDGIPAAIQKRLELLGRRESFQQVHWPEPDARFTDLQAARTPAHRRLIFEELFYLEVGLELKRKRLRQERGVVFEINDKVREAVKKMLPFHPTAAQKRVLKEIADDMQQGSPMRRLLQGDVGSGKTIVALQAAVIAIENGYQVALMAPTEILATQHYLSARKVLEAAGYRVLLLTGSLEQDRKRSARRHIEQGNAQLVIGTHALIQEKVEFDRLGLVIVDEQHRFGVMQRFKLMKKKAEDVDPDVLVMTATPIPRTLALTLYGDLETSIIDELPPGRTPVVTRRVGDERADEVWSFVRKQALLGHQAYVVYPVIEDKEDTLGVSEAEQPAPKRSTKMQMALDGMGTGKTSSGLKAAVSMYDQLRKKVFPELKVGLIHGRLSAEEKDEVMRAFKAGGINVLVATTVIEVGVDVPNASVMVIEHAERFGLSQLHQLRGRIGRGAAKSYCVLMTGGKVTPEAEQRLDAMVRTSNGFEIAELDLELRGPGEFFGTKQAGMPGFRVANLLRDRELLELAKREAAAVVMRTDPAVSDSDVKKVMEQLRLHWQRRYGLVEVG